MINYKEWLDKLYLEEKENECPPKNKLQFLGSVIFDFTTYDGEADELFAKRMLEVIDCILKRNTFKYQEDEDNYINYLLMVNMPFLNGRLSWGTSIRGAWFDEYGYGKEKEEDRVYEITYGWKIPKSEIVEFMTQLVEWSKEEEQQ